MEHSMKDCVGSLERWWRGRSRLQKISTAVIAVGAGSVLVAALLPEVAVTAAGGALTAAAAWVVHKGVAG